MNLHLNNQTLGSINNKLLLIPLKLSISILFEYKQIYNHAKEYTNVVQLSLIVKLHLYIILLPQKNVKEKKFISPRAELKKKCNKDEIFYT